MEICDEYSLPRLVFVNKIDRDNADSSALSSKIGTSELQVVAIQAPIGTQANFKGVVDLVSMKAYVGAKGDEAEIPAEVMADAKAGATS